MNVLLIFYCCGSCCCCFCCYCNQYPPPLTLHSLQVVRLDLVLRSQSLPKLLFLVNAVLNRSVFPSALLLVPGSYVNQTGSHYVLCKFVRNNCVLQVSDIRYSYGEPLVIDYLSCTWVSECSPALLYIFVLT